MKNILHTAVLAVALIFVTGPVQAQGFNLKPYIGGGLGAYNTNLEFPGVSDSDTVFGGFGLVGVDFNDYVGAELRFGGAAGGTVYTFLQDSQLDWFFSYLAKLQYPVTPEFRVYGLVGGTTANASASVGSVSLYDEAETGVSFGAGADYRLPTYNQILVGIEWLRLWHNVDVGPVGVGDEWTVDSFVATVKYEF